MLLTLQIFRGFTLYGFRFIRNPFSLCFSLHCTLTVARVGVFPPCRTGRSDLFEW